MFGLIFSPEEILGHTMIYYVYTWKSHRDGGLCRCNSVNACNSVLAVKSVERPAGMVVSTYGIEEAVKSEMIRGNVMSCYKMSSDGKHIYASIPNVSQWSIGMAALYPDWAHKTVEFE